MRKILSENSNEPSVKFACSGARPRASAWGVVDSKFSPPRLAALVDARRARRILFSQNFIARGGFFRRFFAAKKAAKAI